MGYQESWLYIQPQWRFSKLIKAYDRTEQSGYYKVAGAEPRSVIILKQPFGELPSGTKLLWVCGDRCFHTLGGIFAGNLKCGGRIRTIPIESVLDGPTDRRIDGIDLDSSEPSENEYMKRYSAAHYAHRLRAGQIR